MKESAPFTDAITKLSFWFSWQANSHRGLITLRPFSTPSSQTLDAWKWQHQLPAFILWWHLHPPRAMFFNTKALLHGYRHGTAELENAMAWLEHLPLAGWMHTHRIYDGVIWDLLQARKQERVAQKDRGTPNCANPFVQKKATQSLDCITAELFALNRVSFSAPQIADSRGCWMDANSHQLTLHI